MDGFVDGVIQTVGKAEVAQAVVIQIDQAQNTARLDDGRQVLDNIKGLVPVILQKKANPDEIKFSQIGQRFYGIAVFEAKAWFAYFSLA